MLSSLRDLPGQAKMSSRRELERFSAIMFSSFKRERGMWGHGNYKGMWQESHMEGLVWK